MTVTVTVTIDDKNWDTFTNPWTVEPTTAGGFDSPTVSQQCGVFNLNEYSGDAQGFDARLGETGEKDGTSLSGGSFPETRRIERKFRITTMDISVIIVSYNTADITTACLESVVASQRVSYEVFVVDNASKDGSAEIISKKFPSVRLIANETNRGFGVANNQALLECTGRYAVFLNPDTTVAPESFYTMVAFMDAHPKAGLAGPKVLNPDGTRQHSVSTRYPGHRYGAADLGFLPGNIACVLGACQIASANPLRELGGFDEDFFLYGEDQDLCLRVRKRGFEIGFIDDAVIMHHGGQSERGTLPVDVFRKKFRATLLFYRKHYRPETVRKLCQRQRRRAFWHIFFIPLQMLMMSDKTDALRKLAKYQALHEEIEALAGL